MITKASEEYLKTMYVLKLKKEWANLKFPIHILIQYCIYLKHLI